MRQEVASQIDLSATPDMLLKYPGRNFIRGRGRGDNLNAQMTACNELYRDLKFALKNIFYNLKYIIYRSMNAIRNMLMILVSH